MAEQIFSWSEKDVSLQRLVEEFQGQLPVVAMATNGYTGADSVLHEIGYGEVYWIFAVQRQQRVVARDISSRYLSIPVESHFLFQQQRRDTQALSRPLTLGQIIQHGYDQRIVFERNQSVTFLLGADSRSTTQFGVIDVMDSYDEKYLLGRLVLASGELCNEVVAIPVYLPIRLSVAKSLKVGNEDHFRSWKQSLMEERSRSGDKVELCKEILIFDELPNNSYEYINPNVYVKALTPSADQSTKKAPRLPPTKLLKSSCPILPQCGTSRFDSESTFTPERETPTGECISTTKEDKSITKEDFFITKRDDSTTKGAISITKDYLTTKGNNLITYENVGLSSSLAVLVPSIPPVPKFQKKIHVNLHPGLPTVPTYENTPPSPAIPLRTIQRNQPTTVNRGCPEKPPPRGKRPPVPITRGTVTPQGLSPLTPTPARPPFEKHHSEPGYNSWKTLRDIPIDIDMRSLSVEGVARCIQLLGFEDKAEIFKKEFVDGRLLLALDENTLTKDFGFRAIEAKKVLLFVREGWQPKVTES